MPMSIPCLLPRLPSGRFNSQQEEENDVDLTGVSESASEVDTQGDAQGGDTQGGDTEKTDNQKLLRLLEEGEKVRATGPSIGWRSRRGTKFDGSPTSPPHCAGCVCML